MKNSMKKIKENSWYYYEKYNEFQPGPSRSSPILFCTGRVVTVVYCVVTGRIGTLVYFGVTGRVGTLVYCVVTGRVGTLVYCVVTGRGGTLVYCVVTGRVGTLGVFLSLSSRRWILESSQLIYLI